jgi:hypothetical protein
VHSLQAYLYVKNVILIHFYRAPYIQYHNLVH